jgi:phage shock protein PspC (stress-responsive transcriptional regulator)
MKTLFRSKTNRKVFGVCSGLGEYFNLDPTIIRIIWLSAVLLAGTGILVYIVAWLIIPENEGGAIEIPSKTLTRSSTNKIIAGVCGGLGHYFSLDPVLFRLGFLFLGLVGGWGLILYIVLWIAVPLNSTSEIE